MAPGHADDELVELSLTLGDMLRGVASRWKTRAGAGRLGSRSLEETLRFVDSLEQAAAIVAAGTRDGQPLPRSETSGPTLVESEERFRILVDGVADYAIFMLDPDGHILSWNVGADRIKGYRAEEIVGKHFSIFYPPEDVAAGKPDRELEIAARDGRYAEDGIRLRKGGERFWASVTIFALRDPGGKIRGFGKVTRDLTELRAAIDAHERSEERFRLMIEAVRDYAIFLLDPTGRIASWNVGAQRLKGYAAEEVIGSHFSIFYSDEDRQRGHPDDELRIAKAEGRYEEEGWRYRKDGSRFWANVVLTALFDASGQHIGFTKVTRDFTDARRLREAQVAVQVRDEFISVASHELRTPLAAMLMHLEGILRTARPDDSAPRLRERLEKAVRAGDKLEKLLNDLLDVSRISSGNLQLVPEAVTLGDLVKEVVARFSAPVPIEVVVETEARGLWDPDRLEQVVTNLVSNAIKYGGSAPVRIEVTAAADEAVLRVVDHGIGIAPDQLQSIFEPFRRATNSRKFGGFGLGLWISRRIVDASNGRLEVESEPGRGTTFLVRLPLARTEPALVGV